MRINNNGLDTVYVSQTDDNGVFNSFGKVGKIKSFDGIRTMAFMMIFLSHIGRKFTILNEFCFGVVGVQIFFLMSGFLCLYTYRANSYNLVRESWVYYLKKLKKVYPLHLITFWFAFSLQLWWVYKYQASGQVMHLVKSAIPNLLLIQTFFYNFGNDFNWVTWFLADIMFFYSLTPVLVRLTKKCSSIPQILMCMLAVFIIQVCIVIISPIENQAYYIYEFPISRLFDFGMGMLLAELYIRVNKKVKNTSVYQALSIISLFVLMIMSYILKIEVKYTYTLLFEFSICLTIFFSANDFGDISIFLGKPVFNFFSSISMGFFLIHQLVIRYLEEYSISFSYIDDTKYYVLCFVFAFSLAIAWKYVSRLFAMK